MPVRSSKSVEIPDLFIASQLISIRLRHSPGRAAPVGRCDVVYTPRWALHKAVAGHRRGRQRDRSPWPRLPVGQSPQTEPHCTCNCRQAVAGDCRKTKPNEIAVGGNLVILK